MICRQPADQCAFEHEMSTPVLRPGVLIVPRFKGSLFAVTQGIDTGGRDPSRYEVLFRCLRPSISQGKVVSFRPSLIAVILDQQPHRRTVADSNVVSV